MLGKRCLAICKGRREGKDLSELREGVHKRYYLLLPELLPGVYKKTEREILGFKSFWTERMFYLWQKVFR